ncbi:MAG: sigma-70 family RNA polymerase sigma factor [bacterium]
MELEIIKKVIDGDRKSTEKFYTQCKLKVKAYLKCNYKNHNDVDDDTSEIIIKIYENLSKYNPKKSKFETWVKTIAKNYMIDKDRCSNKYFIISIDDFKINNDATTSYKITRSSSDKKRTYLEIPTDEPNQEEKYENKEIIFSLTSSINSVDNNLLTMKYVQGYSYDDIAMEHRISSSTASNKVNYIKTKLKNGKG